MIFMITALNITVILYSTAILIGMNNILNELRKK